MRTLKALGGRTFGSGPRALFTLAALVAIASVVIAVVPHGSHRSASKFGGYPSFLPASTVNSTALHNIEDASAQMPVLATQGDAVRVHTETGTALIRVDGPEVPNEGLPFYQSPVSPATWTVTLSQVTGTVPLRVKDFDSIDDNGESYKLSQVTGAAALPATLTTGQTASFKLTTVMKTGEGLFRWFPDEKRIPVRWDFVVEDD